MAGAAVYGGRIVRIPRDNKSCAPIHSRRIPGKKKSLNYRWKPLEGNRRTRKSVYHKRFEIFFFIHTIIIFVLSPRPGVLNSWSGQILPYFRTSVLTLPGIWQKSTREFPPL